MPARPPAVLAATTVLGLAGLAAAAGGAPPPRDVATIALPGAAGTARLWREAGVEHYAIDLGGDRRAERTLDPVLHLRAARFDPLADPDGDGVGAGAPPIPEALAPGPDERLWIVQFRTQALEAYRAALRDLGAEVHQHLPAAAHLVRMDRDLVERVAALPFVRWVGPYAPQYRTTPELAAALVAGAADPARALAPRRYVIRLVAPTTDRAGLAAAIPALGGVVDRARAGALLLEATLDGPALRAVLRRDEVLHVDPWGPYETDMDVARQYGGADFLEQVAGYDGTGVTGEVMDSGFNVDHVDFASRPLLLHTGPNSGSHGASTSGIVFGDGTGQANKRGMLPGGQGIVANFNAGIFEGANRYDHTAELLLPPYEAVFQSCSFGSPRTTYYANVSAEMDQIIFDLDLTICQSQSNSGSTLSRPQAWAKNIVSVGGVNHESTLSRSDDNWGGGASIGPAEDGRMKPDLTHFYDGIGTVTSGGSNAYTEGFGGTSGATPIVAGHFGLLYDMWADGVFGNEVVPGGDVFVNRPSQAMAKAMMINLAEAYDWTNGGPNGDLARARQGWGMPSVERLWDVRDRMLLVDEDDVLLELGSRTYTVTVLGNEPELRVTLTWADPPGTSSATLHRINDLDLTVTAPDGTVYRGNGGLGGGLWSTPGGQPNSVDTVENVFVEDPDAGTWLVTVHATELNDDGRPETPGVDADFALVASGVEVVPPPLVVYLDAPVPTLIPAGTPLELPVVVGEGLESPVPGTERLLVRFGDGDFEPRPLVPTGEPGVFTALVDDAPCATQTSFYVEVEGDEGTVVRAPAGAPAVSYGFGVGEVTDVLVLDFEDDAGFTVEDQDVVNGSWERGLPSGGQPSEDFDGSGQCWMTGITGDLDGGPTTLLSPVYDLSGAAAPGFSYARWVTVFGGTGPDSMRVEVSDDGGASWTLVETASGPNGQWVERSFPLTAFVEPTDQVRFRFSVTDGGNDSVVHGALDAFRLSRATCPQGTPDLDGDGIVGFEDLLALLAGWGDCPAPPAPCAADLDGDGLVGFEDLLVLLAAWTEG